MDDMDELAADLRARLLAGSAEADASGEDLTQRIRTLVDREAAVLDAGARADLAGRIAERAFGLGPLEPLLRDPAVEEVMVSGTAPVWVERRGRLERTAVRFGHERDLRDAIERILAPLGRRVDEAEPLCDARLPDGSRVNVVIPPLALDGPVLTIRRFRRRGFTPDELVANGTLSRPLLDFLARAVRARATVLVCGGTGSGKTTTLNALSSFIGAGERVITIEDAAELRLRQPHVIRLERGRRTSRAAAKSPFAGSCATRSACGPTGSWSARCAARRRSTCSPRSPPATTARCALSTPAPPPRRSVASRRSR
jgi:pilus assembly protein CpaF